MSGKTIAKSKPADEETVETSPAHPLDLWLKRELQALYGDSERDVLPPGIAELARRLEERLKQAEGGSGKAGSNDGAGGGGRSDVTSGGRGAMPDRKR